MNHDHLIKDAEKIAQACGVSIHTVRSWKQRKSIPHDQWPAIIANGFATLADLAPDLAEVVSSEDRSAA